MSLPQNCSLAPQFGPWHPASNSQAKPRMVVVGRGFSKSKQRSCRSVAQTLSERSESKGACRRDPADNPMRAAQPSLGKGTSSRSAAEMPSEVEASRAEINRRAKRFPWSRRGGAALVPSFCEGARLIRYGCAKRILMFWRGGVLTPPKNKSGEAPTLEGAWGNPFCVSPSCSLSPSSASSASLILSPLVLPYAQQGGLLCSPLSAAPGN